MKQYDEIMNELETRFKECPEVPESLSRDNIVKAIKEKDIKQEKKKTFNYKIEAIAAVLAVIIVIGVAVAQGGFGNKVFISNDKETVNDKPSQSADMTQSIARNEMADANSKKLPEGVYTFDSSESAKKHILEIYKENIHTYNYFNDDIYFDYELATNALAMAPGASVEESADGVKNEAATDTATGSYGKTNVQVVGVDEGDVIKNDGRYIYIASGGSGYEARIKIIDAQSMEIVYNGKILEKDNENVIINEIYVIGNTLTVVYEYAQYEDDYYVRNTNVAVYDISDRATPKKITSKSQDGYFISSRMIDSVIYTVSLHRVRGKDEKEVEKYALPTVDGEEINGCLIYHFDDNSTAYTVVTALDTSKETDNSSEIAILGAGNEIYCSGNTLYSFAGLYEDNIDKTVITSFSLKGTKIECKAQGTVKGRYNNNYSFDEYNGYLRCAVTYYDYTKFKNVSSIYVLDEKLETVGTLSDIADDEQVKSVRFMGDRGYVVTFRQTDPLFSLDLKDPKNPKVMGELKLPGYSTYLHPLSENTLLGIGYGGDEENANTNDLKIALFDISDMTSPKLLDEFIIECAQSEVNYEPKALIHYAEKNIIGIPVESYHYSAYEARCVKSYAVLNYTDNKISQVTGFVHDSEEMYGFFRGTYIGENLYTIDRLKVMEHSLQSGEKLRECTILKSEEKIAEKYETITTPAVPPVVVTEGVTQIK